MHFDPSPYGGTYPLLPPSNWGNVTVPLVVFHHCWAVTSPVNPSMGWPPWYIPLYGHHWCSHVGTPPLTQTNANRNLRQNKQIPFLAKKAYTYPISITLEPLRKSQYYINPRLADFFFKKKKLVTDRCMLLIQYALYYWYSLLYFISNFGCIILAMCLVQDVWNIIWIDLSWNIVFKIILLLGFINILYQKLLAKTMVWVLRKKKKNYGLGIGSISKNPSE